MPLPHNPSQLQKLYGARFAANTKYRSEVWKVLVRYFGQWISAGSSVLDLGAGYCEFINNLSNASARYAMDLNPETRERADASVIVFQQDCSERWPLSDGELDVVFTSNFLEHLPNKSAVQDTLTNAFRCLKPGGRMICLGPNIKYVPGAYWDFFDHYVPLTELSLAEAMVHCGFRIEKQVGRFLPYTMSGGQQPPIWMLQVYLEIPAAWRLFGRQFLIVANKAAA
jgi:SAM-dependent methyltransferase